MFYPFQCRIPITTFTKIVPVDNCALARQDHNKDLKISWHLVTNHLYEYKYQLFFNVPMPIIHILELSRVRTLSNECFSAGIVITRLSNLFECGHVNNSPIIDIFECGRVYDLLIVFHLQYDPGQPVGPLLRNVHPRCQLVPVQLYIVCPQ